MGIVIGISNEKSFKVSVHHGAVGLCLFPNIPPFLEH
jgi:hypothetical protein